MGMGREVCAEQIKTGQKDAVKDMLVQNFSLSFLFQESLIQLKGL